MANSYAIYAVSDHDEPVIAAVAAAFPPEATPRDDGETVRFVWPARRVVVWRDDYAEPDISSQPVRQIFVWAGGDNTVPAALDVIDQLRAHDLRVIVDPAHPDLAAADQTRTPAAS